jgi:acetyl-CoA C-acetyltransferase
MSRDAVIVSAARTPIGRAYRGAFNATSGATLGALSLKEAVARAGIEPGEVDDVLWAAISPAKWRCARACRSPPAA